MKSFFQVLTEPTNDRRVKDWIENDRGFMLSIDVPAENAESIMDREQIEVWIEPLMFGQYYLAIYRVWINEFGDDCQELISPKVPIRPGGPMIQGMPYDIESISSAGSSVRRTREGDPEGGAGTDTTS